MAGKETVKSGSGAEEDIRRAGKIRIIKIPQMKHIPLAVNLMRINKLN